ncbi:gre1p [Saccharomyces arboricola H-6]|uniref:Gre1p n=1 Tax=Saccharomyces arboricola (strain H-6 / AS 2.3317 / CBS 10644) TaxID=1160507 RepID=J8PVT8_SACAR|nr:gre1p [Saccharomyces arboricola H-6]
MSNLLNKFADKLHGNDHDERYEDDNDDQSRQQRHEQHQQRELRNQGSKADTYSDQNQGNFPQHQQPQSGLGGNRQVGGNDYQQQTTDYTAGTGGGAYTQTYRETNTQGQLNDDDNDDDDFLTSGQQQKQGRTRGAQSNRYQSSNIGSGRRDLSGSGNDDNSGNQGVW